MSLDSIVGQQLRSFDIFIALGHFGEVRKANWLKSSSDVAVVAVKTMKGNFKYCLKIIPKISNKKITKVLSKPTHWYKSIGKLISV